MKSFNLNCDTCGERIVIVYRYILPPKLRIIIVNETKIFYN